MKKLFENSKKKVSAVYLCLAQYGSIYQTVVKLLFLKGPWSSNLKYMHAFK